MAFCFGFPFFRDPPEVLAGRPRSGHRDRGKGPPPPAPPTSKKYLLTPGRSLRLCAACHAHTDQKRSPAPEPPRVHPPGGMGPHAARLERLLVPRTQRRLLPRQRAGRRGCRHARFGEPGALHNRRVGGGRGQAGAVAGAGPEMGAAGHARRAGRAGGRDLSAAEEGPHAGVSCAPSRICVRARICSARCSALRSRLAFAVHQFFQERDFVYVHTPIITASDCEGAGEMFRVTTLKGNIDEKPEADFFGKPTLPDGERPARRRDLRLRAVQHLHVSARRSARRTRTPRATPPSSG